MTTWRSRIVDTGEVDPRSLTANPKNWRKHPKHQADALAGVLGEVGWVQDVIVNRTTGRLVDGHLRVEIAASDKQPTIPVTYVELSEAEEALILATFDPISAMATADAEILRDLLDDVSSGDAAVQQMIADLAEREGVVAIGDDVWGNAFAAIPDGDKSPFEKMTFTVTTEQAETIRSALANAKHAGPFVGTGNGNKNGNALGRIAEAYNRG